MVVSRIAHLDRHVGETVTIQGWLYNRRSSGKIHFLQVRDGSGIAQGIALRKSFSEDEFQIMGALPYETSVEVDGEVRADDRAPGGFELQVTRLRVVTASEEYPISKKEHGPDFLLSHRHLWLRSRKQVALMRIRDEVIRAIRDFFHDEGFVCIDAPVFTPNACEGTTTLFEVDYFEDEKAYLTQSGQLYMEAAAMALGKVYCFGPVFRAEKSKTRRHLTEFWMVEPEMAFADLDDCMELAESLLCAIVDRVLSHRLADLEALERDVERLGKVRRPFPRMSYDEAVELLTDSGHSFEWGGDFGAPDETFLGNQIDCPLMVHHYPKEVKAFYMKGDPTDDRLALGVDVLAPEGFGEIIGGGQREDDLGVLQRKIVEHHLSPEVFE